MLRFACWFVLFGVQTVKASTKAAVLNSQSVVAEAVGTTDKCGDQLKMFETNSTKQPQCIGPLLALAKQHGERDLDAESHKVEIYHHSFLLLTVTKRQISPLFTYITISRCYWTIWTHLCWHLIQYSSHALCRRILKVLRWCSLLHRSIFQFQSNAIQLRMARPLLAIQLNNYFQKWKGSEAFHHFWRTGSWWQTICTSHHCLTEYIPIWSISV